METMTAVIVMALVTLFSMGTLCYVAIRIAYAFTALSSKESAEVLAELNKPVEKVQRKQEVEVPPDLANPAWSTRFASDMTDVADPNRSNGVS